MIIARIIFCLSVGTTLFWFLGFAAERFAGAEPSFWAYAAPALLFTIACFVAVFRGHPEFLAPKHGSVGAFLRSAVLWTIAAYVAGVALVGSLASLLLYLIPPVASPESDGERSLAVYLLAVWFPLWFAPALGLALSWWRCRSKAHAV